MKRVLLAIAAAVVMAGVAAIWYYTLKSQSEPMPDALRGGKYSEVCGVPNPPLFCSAGSGTFEHKCRVERMKPGELCTPERAAEHRKREEAERGK